MKKIIFLFLLSMMFIPFIVNAETCNPINGKNYSIDNLKIGQEFNTGDMLYRTTPEDEFLDDPESISYITGQLHKLSNYYAIPIDFENRVGGGSAAFGGVIIGYGNISNCHSNICDEIDCDKNIYWKLDRVETLVSGEVIKLYFKSYKRAISLNIINKVNNVDKYIANKGEVLKYSIIITNTGDGYSENNMISTVIPAGIEIDKNTISDNGTYNDETNTISWSLDELGPNNEYTFNYYGKIIDDSITEYVANSYITSNQVQEKVESNDTIVNIEKKINIPDTITNPDTRSGIAIIIIEIILVTSSATYMLLKRKKNIL